MNQIKRIMAIDPWQIKSDTLEIEDRRLQESLTAIGNGYMGMICAWLIIVIRSS